MKQKFKIDDIIRYNGNIYQIIGIKVNEQNHIYDVKCVKNNFHDELVSSSIGSCAEDKMELVEFKEPNEKEQWIEKACKWLKENVENYYYLDEAYDKVISTKILSEDFRKHMKES